MSKQKFDIKLIIIMIVAIASRLILLGVFPGGVHADEAFAGYEAYSMLKYGVDSWGYHNPVYLCTWGGGMSVLESYLMMPFVSLFGLNTVTVKIPQVVFGILAVYVFYLLLNAMYDTRIAYWGGFLLAISPWHIMMNRWGLDCNLAPEFIVFAVYFAVKGLEKNSYLLLSAFIFGISLYTYALTWIFVPLFLAGSLAYCIKYEKIKLDKTLISAVLILIVMALPLILFVAVNIGLIPEIQTTWISIPRMYAFRSGEMTLSGIPDNVVKFLKTSILQYDYWDDTAIRGFGVYYLFSTPIALYGLFVQCRRCICDCKRRKFGYDFILLWWVLCGALLGCIQVTAIHKINIFWMGMFIPLTVGVSELCTKLRRHGTYAIIGIYAVSFLLFEGYYFSDSYQQLIAGQRNAGLDEALEYALSQSQEEEIYVVGPIRHSQILFWLEYPTTEYTDSVEWIGTEGAKEVSVQRFGSFTWDWDNDAPKEGVYIIRQSDVENYELLGYQVETFESCAVAVK